MPDLISLTNIIERCGSLQMQSEKELSYNLGCCVKYKYKQHAVICKSQ